MSQVESRIDSPKEEELHQFQGWMRNSTDLGPGTVVQYRRELAKVLDENAESTVEIEDLSGHSKSAYRKYLEFVAKTTDEGENQ